MNNKILHIIMGAIGTGKSTLAEILSTKYKIEVLSADSIEKQMNEKGVFNDNEIDGDIIECFYWYLDKNTSFILDGLNLSRKSRNYYINEAIKKGFQIYIYDLGPGNDDSLQRRLKNPRNVPTERWINIAKSNKESYEKPMKNEEKITKLFTMH